MSNKNRSQNKHGVLLAHHELRKPIEILEVDEVSTQTSALFIESGNDAAITTDRVGISADLKRSSADINKSSADINGSSADINGSSADINGSSADINGSSADINGSSADINGSSADINGSSADINGSSADINGSSESKGESQSTTLTSFLNRLARKTQKEHPYLWEMKVPVLLLAAIGIFPKLIFLWFLFILGIPLLKWSYRNFPEHIKLRVQELFPTVFQNRKNELWREVEEGADQCLPFVLFSITLFGPLALIWFIGYWLKSFFNKPTTKPEETEFIFSQNRRHDDSENNFYSSRAFGIVFLAFFALGIPALFSYQVYEKSGMEHRLTHVKPNNSNISLSPLPPPVRYKFESVVHDQNSAHQRLDRTIRGCSGFWPWLRNINVEPSKNSIFFVHFYLMSITFALCAVFFRTWFTFPLNFASDEHDVVVTASGISRKNLKCWFYNVITINRWSIGGGPDTLLWSEVNSLRLMEDGFTRLSPLPETAFKKESLTYQLLNKIASFIDGVSNKANTDNYLIFSSATNGGDFGRNIKINLNELGRERRARLFYFVKHWAPHVEVQKNAEEQLLGSRVLTNNRYTKLWFDILTSRTQRTRTNALASGDSLKRGTYLIIDHISTGGQATAYLATNASGKKCVLKEFILASNASSTGALLESAREFEAEVSLLSQISHPGIVTLDDFFVEDGRVYVVLEHIEGQSLRQKVMQSGPLSEKQVAQIASSVCDVLEYLHGQVPPIIHRDITPENILILADGTIKVIDFSLAIRKEDGQTTDSCAKLCFTPPEQFRDEVSTQSDIYALGATMYYLLTGTVPKPISCSSPIARAAAVSPGMNAIVERATQLELSQRYESAQWLKIDLTSLE